MEKKYYKSLEELTFDSQASKGESEPGDRKYILEMQEQVKTMPASSRRDFLKVFGFTIASTAITMSCRQPVHKAIPYLVQPEGITPGKASYYASGFFDGNDFGSVIVKVRDGRPIKIEGNTHSSVTGGGTSARVQASVLNLYDNSRYKGPLSSGEATTWETADAAIAGN
jgi:anaerobic selenocysteine-containing dehydrogenase